MLMAIKSLRGGWQAITIHSNPWHNSIVRWSVKTKDTYGLTKQLLPQEFKKN